MIGSIARDDLGFAREPARELYRVFVGVRAGQRKENTAACQTSLFDQAPSELDPRWCAPARLDVAHPICLNLDRCHDFRVLVTEVAAFGHAAHIKISPTLRINKPRTLAAVDHGRVPLRLDRPGVQHGSAFFGGEIRDCGG